MGINIQTIQLCPFVYYDDYDEKGLLLALRQGILLELNERETRILSRLLQVDRDDTFVENMESENEKNALLERLYENQLITSEREDAHHTPLFPLDQQLEIKCPRENNLIQERLMGVGEIIIVLNKLRNNFYSAYQYLYILQRRRITASIHSEDEDFQRANQDYWVYRLVTGCFERKIARLLGQTAKEEGLCLVKGFALCAYLLSIGIDAQIVIARPLYGSRSNFKLHAWVEVNGKPFNEYPNIHDGFRVICSFPYAISVLR